MLIAEGVSAEYGVRFLGILRFSDLSLSNGDTVHGGYTVHIRASNIYLGCFEHSSLDFESTKLNIDHRVLQPSVHHSTMNDGYMH
jgi:hypothetical protein